MNIPFIFFFFFTKYEHSLFLPVTILLCKIHCFESYQFRFVTFHGPPPPTHFSTPSSSLRVIDSRLAFLTFRTHCVNDISPRISLCLPTYSRHVDQPSHYRLLPYHLPSYFIFLYIYFSSLHPILSYPGGRFIASRRPSRVAERIESKKRKKKRREEKGREEKEDRERLKSSVVLNFS